MSLIVAVNPGFGSSIGVFRDGEPVFCVEEERFNRTKNWLGFPHEAFKYIHQNVVKMEEVDEYVITNIEEIPSRSRESFYEYYDNYFAAGVEMRSKADIEKYRRRLDLYKTSFYQAYRKLRGGGGAHGEGEEQAAAALASHGVPADKIKTVDHHLCHAAAAYHGLADDLDKPYLVFSLDGGGDGKTAVIYKAQGGKMELLASSETYSIGNMYSASTYFLGFTPHEHEYKLMGLAPYVKEKYYQHTVPFFRQFLDLKDGDTTFHNPEPLNHAVFFSELKQHFVRERFDNISAGLQVFCEEIVTRWVKGNIKKYGISDILCSGGVFMNVKMNMLLSKLPEVNSINVHPSCGDETNIFGGAFHRYSETVKPKVNLLSKFSLGTDAGEPDAALQAKYEGRATFERVENVNQSIATLLADNQIVARCTGEMEFGARALGNRSIMANPSNLRNVTKINQAIKNRDFWMPFAPAVLAEDLEEYVIVPDSLKPHLSPYMMFAFDTIPHKREEMVCGVHQADHTARVETIDSVRYPDFHAIITHFKSLTGSSVVLNTSFNLHGFPIVENAEQAVEVLLNSKLDVLALGNWLVRRVD